MINSSKCGFSLVMVIMLATILSLMVLILMSQQRQTNKLATRIGNQFTRDALQQTELTRETLRIRERLKAVMSEDKLQYQREDLSRDIWTLQYDTSAVSTSDVIPLFGLSADDLFPYSLRINNEGTPFVLSAGAYLDDDLMLADTLVQYSPPRLDPQSVVKGKIKQIEEDEEVSVSEKLILIYTSQFEHHLHETRNNTRETDRTSLAFEIIDTDEEIQSIAGDLTGPFYLKESDKLDTLIVSGTVTFTADTHINKHLVIISGMEVFLKDSTTATDIVIYTRGGIYLENSSQIRGTLFSGKQILVTDNAKCLYPSNLIVPKNDEKIYGQPEIGIVRYASVEGLVCVYKHEEEAPQQRYSIPAKVKKGRNATVYGGIYCEGNVEAYGTIKGFIHAEGFEQVIKRTRWVNYLQDIQILRKAIGPDFPLPPIFNEPRSLKVLGLYNQ